MWDCVLKRFAAIAILLNKTTDVLMCMLWDVVWSDKVIFGFLVIIAALPIKCAIHGVYEKKSALMKYHLLVQGVFLVMMFIFSISSLSSQSQKDYLRKVFTDAVNDGKDRKVELTDNQIFLYTLIMIGIIVGLSSLCFVITLKYYLKIKGEIIVESQSVDETVPYERLEVDHSCTVIPMDTPEHPRKANPMNAIPLPWPKPQEK
ncbi:uncharacterized protein LOC135847835 isoform X1 [Planococcus citri]|uniref:uncharacterized protein LOC135847835 isoform X1 n=1 Tax=Planococcus citri TaxID=170843 RepID=UPI0031F7EE46